MSYYVLQHVVTVFAYHNFYLNLYCRQYTRSTDQKTKSVRSYTRQIELRKAYPSVLV